MHIKIEYVHKEPREMQISNIGRYSMLETKADKLAPRRAAEYLRSIKVTHKTSPPDPSVQFWGLDLIYVAVRLPQASLLPILKRLTTAQIDSQ